MKVHVIYIDTCVKLIDKFDIQDVLAYYNNIMFTCMVECGWIDSKSLIISDRK